MNNSSMFLDNETTECLARPNTIVITHSSVEVALYSFFGVLMCLVAFMGNIFVIIVIIKDPSLSKHKPNLYLLSLAFSDALMAAFTMPFSLVFELIGSWPFGQVYCYIHFTLDKIFVNASIWNIAFIGFDRYASVRFPILFRQYKTVRKIRIAIIGIWVYSVFLAIFPYFVESPDFSKDDKQCTVIIRDWEVVLASVFLSFYIPAILIIPVYSRIFMIGRRVGSGTFKKKTRRLSNNGRSPHGSQSDNRSTSQNDSSTTADSAEEIETKSSGSSPFRLLRLPLFFIRRNGNEKYLKPELPEKMDRGIEGKSNEHSLSSVEVNNALAPYAGTNLDSKVVLSVSSRYRRNPSPVKSEERCKTTKPKRRERVSSLSSKNSKSKSINARRNTAPPELNRHSKSKCDDSVRLRRHISASQAQISHRERRFMFIILLVTGLFLIFWTPFFVTALVLRACPSCCINIFMWKFFYFLGYINSCVNPVIYTIFNKDFKTAFKKLLRLRRNSR